MLRATTWKLLYVSIHSGYEIINDSLYLSNASARAPSTIVCGGSLKAVRNVHCKPVL